MDKIKDPIFGEMVYDYSWEKEEEFLAFGRDVNLRVVAKAYSGQDIRDVQREAYITYKSNLSKYIMNVPGVLLDYYLRNYEFISSCVSIPDKISKDNINKELISKLIRIKTLYIDRKGQFGWLCDCAWDSEHGLCILLSGDSICIKEQDYLL